MLQATTNWVGGREWVQAMKGLMLVSYVVDVGPLRIVGASGDTRAQVIAESTRPLNYLSSAGDPVLAKIWDNPEDDIYDTL